MAKFRQPIAGEMSPFQIFLLARRARNLRNQFYKTKVCAYRTEFHKIAERLQEEAELVIESGVLCKSPL